MNSLRLRVRRRAIVMVLSIPLLLLGSPDTRAIERAGSESPALTWVPFDRPFGVIGFPDEEFGPHWETIRLATLPEAQDELKLSTEQREDLESVRRSLFAKRKLWHLGSDDPDALLSEYNQTLSILTEEQNARIDQFIFRRLGCRAHLEPRFARQFGATDSQIAEFKHLWQDHLDRPRGGNLGRESFHLYQILAFGTLTPKQQQRFLDRIGPPLAKR